MSYQFHLSILSPFWHLPTSLLFRPHRLQPAHLFPPSIPSFPQAHPSFRQAVHFCQSIRYLSYLLKRKIAGLKDALGRHGANRLRNTRDNLAERRKISRPVSTWSIQWHSATSTMLLSRSPQSSCSSAVGGDRSSRNVRSNTPRGEKTSNDQSPLGVRPLAISNLYSDYPHSKDQRRHASEYQSNAHMGPSDFSTSMGSSDPNLRTIFSGLSHVSPYDLEPQHEQHRAHHSGAVHGGEDEVSPRVFGRLQRCPCGIVTVREQRLGQYSGAVVARQDVEDEVSLLVFQHSKKSPMTSRLGASKVVGFVLEPLMEGKMRRA